MTTLVSARVPRSCARLTSGPSPFHRFSLSQLTAQTRRLRDAPEKTLHERLRALEMKMGLVLTLVSRELVCSQKGADNAHDHTLQFKASVWAVINEQPAVDESQYYEAADDTVMQH